MRETVNRVYPIRMSKKQWNIPIVNQHGDKVNINLFNFEKNNLENNQYIVDYTVIKDRTFFINITYPLLFPVKIKIHKNTDTSLCELIKIVKHIYKNLYRIEEDTSTKYLQINLLKCNKCDNNENILKILKNKQRGKICNICFENIKHTELIQTECKHYYHKNCLQKWINSSKKL